jgi:spermidine/putrescine transport system permease protein
VIRLLRGGFIAIPVLWVAAAHVAPLFAMARISLLNVYPAAPGTPPDYGLQAYAAFLNGPGYRAALGHSLWLAAGATGTCLLLVWPLAWHIAIRLPAALRFRRLALLVAPFWTSEVLRMFAIVLLLANRGALNALLRWMHLTDTPLSLLFAAFDRLPASLLDAAADLGAGSLQRQWSVVLPLAATGIMSGVALTFLLCLGVLAAPSLLGGAGTPVFAVVITGFFAGASGRWPLGAAFSVLLLIVGTACAGGLAWGAKATSGPPSKRVRA